MNLYEKELTPVIYNSAAIKIIKIKVTKDDPLCFRMHWHERMELLRIRKGKIKIDFGKESHIFSEGNVVIIQPNQLHKGTLIGEEVIYDTVMFDVRSFFNDTQICLSTLPLLIDGRAYLKKSTQNSEILKCIDIIIESSNIEEKALYTQANIYKLFYLLYEHCVINIKESSSSDDDIQEIIKYIEENYQADLTTDNLSSRFKYSKPYFCRKFKEATGLSPMNYLKIFRIEKSYRLFRNGEKDISATALKCGFTDPNYFTRCFKAHFGYPPSHYISK